MMDYVLSHLEKALDEMKEAAEGFIDLAARGDETTINYIKIFTSIYTELLALYGLMYSETQHTNE